MYIKNVKIIRPYESDRLIKKDGYGFLVPFAEKSFIFIFFLLLIKIVFPNRLQNFRESVLKKTKISYDNRFKDSGVLGIAVAGSKQAFVLSHDHFRFVVAHEFFHARHPILGLSEILAGFYGGVMSHRHHESWIKRVKSGIKESNRCRKYFKNKNENNS
jgi:hypothetical protein